MSSSSATSSSGGAAPDPKDLVKSFVANAKKNKHGFFQSLAMTGILLLSFRSLGQKYRLNELEEDTSALKQEQESLTERMNKIQTSLLREASLEPSGRFASRLRLLFGDDD